MYKVISLSLFYIKFWGRKAISLLLDIHYWLDLELEFNSALDLDLELETQLALGFDFVLDLKRMLSVIMKEHYVSTYSINVFSVFFSSNFLTRS